MNDATIIAGVLCLAIITAVGLTVLTRWAWNRFWTWTGRTIATHIDRALTPPPRNRYRDLDDEYRALVIAEHNRDND